MQVHSTRPNTSPASPDTGPTAGHSNETNHHLHRLNQIKKQAMDLITKCNTLNTETIGDNDLSLTEVSTEGFPINIERALIKAAATFKWGVDNNYIKRRAEEPINARLLLCEAALNFSHEIDSIARGCKNEIALYNRLRKMAFLEVPEDRSSTPPPAAAPPSVVSIPTAVSDALITALAKPVILELNRGRDLPHGMIYAGNLMEATDAHRTITMDEMQKLAVPQALLDDTLLDVPEDPLALKAVLKRAGAKIYLSVPFPPEPVLERAWTHTPNRNGTVTPGIFPFEVFLHWSFAPWFGNTGEEGEPFSLYLEHVQPAHIRNMSHACLLAFLEVISQYNQEITWKNESNMEESHHVSAVIYLALLMLNRSRRGNTETASGQYKAVDSQNHEEIFDFRVPSKDSKGERDTKGSNIAFARLAGAGIDKHGDELRKFSDHVRLSGMEIGEIIGASYHNLEAPTFQGETTRKLATLVEVFLKREFKSKKSQQKIVQELIELTSFACRAPTYTSLWDHQAYKKVGLNVGVILAGATKFAKSVRLHDTRIQKILEYSFDSVIVIALGAAAGAMGPLAPVGVAVSAPVVSGLFPLISQAVSKIIFPARDWMTAKKEFQSMVSQLTRDQLGLTPQSIYEFKEGLNNALNAIE